MKSPDLRRIEHIRDYCCVIQKTLTRCGQAFETFTADTDYEQSIAFSVFQIGELSGGLSEEFREKTSADIPWQMIRGMRNIIVHNYGNVDKEILWQVATEDIPILLAFCEEILGAQP